MTSTGTKRWAGLLLAAIPAAAIDNGLGRVPPFGWRSWNCFHGNVNQSNIERQVDALVKPNQNASWGEAGKSLLDFGYASIGLDDNWQACGAGVNGSFHNIDGTPLINTKTFPDMAGMVEYVLSSLRMQPPPPYKHTEETEKNPVRFLSRGCAQLHFIFPRFVPPTHPISTQCMLTCTLHLMTSHHNPPGTLPSLTALGGWVVRSTRAGPTGDIRVHHCLIRVVSSSLQKHYPTGI